MLFYLTANADYRYLSLSRLVCEADYAATGTIVRYDRNYFYLKVADYLFGRLPFDTLRIQKFEDWSCGRRYDKYRVGQKELVFFRKSNYVIEDYELLGYGGGGEFELPIREDSIFYRFSYRGLKSYHLGDFLTALKDFNVVKQKTRETSVALSMNEQAEFASRSAIHKLFIECKSYRNESTFEIPLKGYIVNLESNTLYQGYENKVHVTGFDPDSIVLSVEDAEVWKQDQYFVVKPKDGWTRRWLKVYGKTDADKKNVLLSQIFEIIELPKPRIYFEKYYQDTIYSSRRAYPSVAHYLDDMHNDEFLEYELLSYTYQITSNGRIETYKINSAYGTNEFRERLRKLKPGDLVTIKDIYVLFPDKTVQKLEPRTVYVGKSE